MTTLHLIRLPIDLRVFTEWALKRKLLSPPRGNGRGRPGDGDIGYALHAILSGMFGSHAPKPFAIPSISRGARGSLTNRPLAGKRTLELLGYAKLPLESLRRLAQVADLAYGPPLTLVDWERAGSRPLPTHWPENLHLRFDLRASPVMRIIKPLTTTAGRSQRPTTFRKGSELDAYQVAAGRAQAAGIAIPGRGQVYVDWLVNRLAPRNARSQPVALVPGSVRVEAYRSVRLLRRPRGSNGRRTRQWLTRPDVSFSGSLTITDGVAMEQLLIRGIGRHCGFGFGMLLLRPA